MFNKLPPKSDLFLVLGLAASIVYSWTIFHSFWSLPSWILYLGSFDIISIYAYSFIVNLVESLLLCGAALIPSLILPNKWWKDKFVSKGSIFVIFVIVSAQVHFNLFRTPDDQAKLLNSQIIWWAGTILVIGILTWVAGRFQGADSLIVEMAERLTVFSYLYIFLTLAGLVIIVMRII